MMFSCSPIVEDNYIDSQLADFYWDFQYEAARLGVSLPNKTIRLVFDDMPGLNGYCQWDNKSMLVRIDKRFFDNNINAGERLAVEATVFHEFGHGYWGRSHTMDTFDSTWYFINTSGDSVMYDVQIPTSIMYSVDKKANAHSFYSELREYYLKELFQLL